MSDFMHTLTLLDVLQEHRRSYPDRTALVQEGRRYTYAELETRVNRLANLWEGLGVGPGERVLWLGQNSLAVLEGILACSALGAMFCPLNWRQSAEEIAFVIDDLQPKVLLWHEGEIGEAVRAARPRRHALKQVKRGHDIQHGVQRARVREAATPRAQVGCTHGQHALKV